MKSINLIPLERRRARAVRKRLTAWSGGLAMWCGLIGTVAAVLLASADGQTRAAVERRRTAAAAALKETETEVAAAEAEIAKAERAVEASDLVEDHPDWSVLLRLVAQTKGDDLAVESVEIDRLVARPGTQPVAKVERAGAARPGKTEAPPPGEVYAVRFTGLAATVGEAQKFVVRLEEMGAFDSVAILDSAPRAVGAFEATWFRVECRVSDRLKPGVQGAKTKEDDK